MKAERVLLTSVPSTGLDKLTSDKLSLTYTGTNTYLLVNDTGSIAYLQTEVIRLHFLQFTKDMSK